MRPNVKVKGSSGGLSCRRRPVPDVLNVPGKEVPYGRAVVAERCQWRVDCEHPEWNNPVLHKLVHWPGTQRVDDEEEKKAKESGVRPSRGTALRFSAGGWRLVGRGLHEKRLEGRGSEVKRWWSVPEGGWALPVGRPPSALLPGRWSGNGLVRGCPYGARERLRGGAAGSGGY